MTCDNTGDKNGSVTSFVVQIAFHCSPCLAYIQTVHKNDTIDAVKDTFVASCTLVPILGEILRGSRDDSCVTIPVLVMILLGETTRLLEWSKYHGGPSDLTL